MKARAPAFSNGGADLAGGYRDETNGARTGEANHWGRNQGKRSPKERSAVPGASQRRRHSSSQRCGGSDLTTPAKATARLGQQDRGGIGTSRWRDASGASRPMPSAQALSTSKYYQNQNSRGDFQMKRTLGTQGDAR